MIAPALGGLDDPTGSAPPPTGPLRRVLAGLARAVASLAVAAGVAAGGYATRDHWVPVLFPVAKEPSDEPADRAEAAGPSERVRLTAQAQKNLRLTAGPLKAETFWKTISVPGIVIDRPGVGDRGVVAPVTGIVARIHKVAGDTARPGEVLFTLKLLSESLHATQTELFKSAQEIKLVAAQRTRLVASAGAVAEARVIEADGQLTRLEVAVKAYRQELLNRGLLPAQIDGVADGKFVGEIPIPAPRIEDWRSKSADSQTDPAVNSSISNLQSSITNLQSSIVEVQEVKVELGQQVQAGQTLCLLADHQVLAVEGRAFRDESPLLERAVKAGWPVEVDFEEEPGHGWAAHGQTFRVGYLANTIDPDSRTFRFVLPLDNQSRVIEAGGKALTLWRFRPGQRVRLLVRIEEIGDVFVLPPEAVARDGADTYLFRQNGDVFDRKPVHVVYQDERHVVVANDGSVPPGVYVAQTGAAQLNRTIKSQTGTAPAGTHVHADGSVHTGKH